eukprot:366566-Chlamydomonas_euryale.AAC.19
MSCRVSESESGTATPPAWVCPSETNPAVQRGVGPGGLKSDPSRHHAERSCATPCHRSPAGQGGAGSASL